MMKRKLITSESEWLHSRGIGGTLASAIIGANAYLSPNDAYNYLVYGESQNVSNEAIERGKMLEPSIRILWNYFNKNYKVEEPPKENWLFYDDEFPFLTASFDGILTDENGNKGILEIKTRQGSTIEWENGMIPKQYYVQCLHYLIVSGYDYVNICCLVLNDDENLRFIQRRIERKDHIEEIEKLKKVEINFYNKCKQKIRPKTIIEFPIVAK